MWDYGKGKRQLCAHEQFVETHVCRNPSYCPGRWGDDRGGGGDDDDGGDNSESSESNDGGGCYGDNGGLMTNKTFLEEQKK